MDNRKTLRVSSKSDSNKIAGMIAHCIQDGEKIELQAIGAGAVNQVVKAIATARGFVATNGIDLYCIPAYCEVDVEDEVRTGIKFILKIA